MRLKVQQWGPAFDRFSEPIRQMLDEMHGPNFFCSHTRPSWNPKVNVFETPSHVIVCMDLAGVTPDDFDIRFASGVLQVAGSRRRPVFPGDTAGSAANDQVSVHLMEIDSGRFSRAVPLPFEIRAEKMEASHRQGFLWIVAPKETAMDSEQT